MAKKINLLGLSLEHTHPTLSLLWLAVTVVTWSESSQSQVCIGSFLVPAGYCARSMLSAQQSVYIGMHRCGHSEVKPNHRKAACAAFFLACLKNLNFGICATSAGRGWTNRFFLWCFYIDLTAYCPGLGVFSPLFFLRAFWLVLLPTLQFVWVHPMVYEYKSIAL